MKITFEEALDILRKWWNEGKTLRYQHVNGEYRLSTMCMIADVTSEQLGLLWGDDFNGNALIPLDFVFYMYCEPQDFPSEDRKFIEDAATSALVMRTDKGMTMALYEVVEHK